MENENENINNNNFLIKKNSEIFYRKFKHLKLSMEDFSKLTGLGYSVNEVDSILDAIENYKNNKNYTSLYLTAKKWLEKERATGKKESKTQEAFNAVNEALRINNMRQ